MPVEGQADILISASRTSRPYNVNSILNPLLVQVMALGYLFNMYRGKPARCKKGGVMIITHPCYDEFDHEHHPSYIEFFHRLLPETRDAFKLREKYEDEFATNPSYIEMYRRGNAYHGAHPFFMWYWGENGRQHVGKVIVVGADNEHVPEILGWERADIADRGDRDGQERRRPVARDHDDAPPADRHGGHGVAAWLRTYVRATMYVHGKEADQDRQQLGARSRPGAAGADWNLGRHGARCVDRWGRDCRVTAAVEDSRRQAQEGDGEGG